MLRGHCGAVRAPLSGGEDAWKSDVNCHEEGPDRFDRFAAGLPHPPSLFLKSGVTK